MYSLIKRRLRALSLSSLQKGLLFSYSPLLFLVLGLGVQIGGGIHPSSFSAESLDVTLKEQPVVLVCGPPTGLRLEIENIFIVRAFWDAVPDVQTYNIRYRPVGSTTWTTLTGLLSPEQLLSVNSSDSYEWEVQAVCDGEISEWISGPVFDSSCDSPNALAVGSTTTTTADLSWAAEPTGQEYELRYRIVGSSTWTTLSIGNTLAFTLQNLTAGSTYEWQVRTNCGNGNLSSWGAGPNFSTTQITCNAPASLSVGTLTGTSAELNWGAVAGTQGYELRYRQTGSSAWTVIQVSGNSVTLQNLEVGVDYEWEVRSDCGNSVSSWVSGTDFQTTCPGPDGLVVDNITETSARVSWNAVAGAQSYNVRYRILATASWTVQTVTATTFDITGLTESTDYEWQVQSNCINGSSDWIRGSNFETLGAPCETATNLTVSNITSSAATLNWTAVPNISTYEVRYRVRGSAAWTTQAVSGTTVQITQLDTFTNYEWQVRTICASSESAWLAGPFFQTLGPTCEAPTGLAVSNITLSSASFSWTAVAGVTGYEIRYRVVGGGEWTVLPSANTSITINALDFSTSYEWQVRSVCAQSSSQWIAGSNFETLGPPCDPPSALTVSNITETTANLSWTATPGEQTYEVRYRVTATATWTVLQVTGTTQALTGLVAGTNYEWQVRTKCAFSNSAWLAGPFFETLATPCPDPTGLAVGTLTVSSAVLNWDAMATASGYQLRYRVKGTSTWTTIDAAQNTSTLNTLVENTLYEWQVQTTCPSNSSAWVSGPDFQTELTPCAAPTGLAVSNVSSSGAQFAWVAVTGAAGYDFRYRVKGTATWTIVDVATNSFTLDALSSETVYEWQVRAECGGNTSEWAPGTDFQTLVTPCASPTELTIIQLTDVSVNLGWTQVASATDYDLRYRVKGTTTWTDLDVAETNTSLSDLSPNTPYEWQVRSNCTANLSEYVSGPDFQTLETPCPVPANLAVSEVSSTSADFSWDPVGEALYYDFRYRVVGAATWTEDSTLGTSYSLADLTPETTYEWQVRTVCANNSSEWVSGPGFQTSIVCPVPINLQVQNITSLTAEIIWDAPATIEGINFTYNIRYRPLGTEEWTLESKGVNSSILSKLDPETDYEWQIQTDCGGGSTSEWIAGPNFKTLVAPCESPSGLKVFDVGQDSATFSWNRIPNAIEYQLRYREVGTDLWVILTTSDTLLILTDLLAGASYNWEVRADCGDTASEWVMGEDFSTDGIPCDPPSNLRVDSLTNTMAWVSWDGYVDATLYRVRFRVNGTEVWTTLETADTTAIFSNLEANTEYQWAAQSECGSIPTEWILGPNFTTLENPILCSPPQNLQVLDTTEFTATLSWSREMGVDSFRVRYRIQGTTQWQIAITSDTLFTLENLTDGVDYQWEVQSICGELFSSWIEGELFTTIDIPTTCALPTDLAVIEVGISSALLSWRIGLQVSGYEVRFKPIEDTEWTTLNTIIGLVTLEELTPVETYQWEVRSLCIDDTSAWVPGPEFTTQGAPLVTLLQPEDSTFLEVGDSVLIEAFALDPDGDSLSVSIFANDSLLIQGDTTLLSFTWSDLPQGLYSIYATVTDSDGNTATSETSRLFVGFDSENFLVGDFIVFGNELCFLDSAQVIFGDASIGAEEYEWKFGEGAFPATADSAGPHVVKYASSGTKTIELTVRDSLGNENVRIKNLTVYIKPQLSNAGEDRVLCGDIDSTLLTAEVQEMGLGTWSLISGAGEILSPDSSQTLVRNLGLGENIFFWEVSNGFCTSDPDTLIVVRGSCVPVLTGEIVGRDTLCLTDVGMVFSVEDDSLIDEYIWTLPEGFEGEVNRNTLTLTQIGGEGGLITVFGKNEFGESATLGRDIVVDPCIGRFQLITFTAYQEEAGDVLLDWVAQFDQEINSYTMERSLDSIEFSEIRTLTPLRDQENRHRYIEPDDFTYGGVIYYRVRIETAEGEIIYSEIVKLILSGLEPLLSVVITPNPIIDEKLSLQVETVRSGLLRIETFDRIGRSIFTAFEPVDAGLNELSFDFSQVAEGVYILKIQKANNGKPEVLKFVR